MNVHTSQAQDLVYANILLLRHYTIWREAEDIQPPIAHESKIGRCGDCDAGVEEGGIFDRVALETLCAELKHDVGLRALAVTWRRDGFWDVIAQATRSFAEFEESWM